jgi:hypothetical protein
MTTTTTNELTNGTNGRWLGQRGIFRHHVPAFKDINPEPGEVVFHTMSTSVAEWADVRGELIRSVFDDGEVSYEARIDGLEDHYGLCDAFSALAKVSNDLRYEWSAGACCDRA